MIKRAFSPHVSNGERNAVHEAIKHETGAMLHAAGHRISIEPPNAYTNSNKRPDIRMIDHFSVGAHRDLDIGTISVTGKICDNAALTDGYGADQVEYDKHSKWDHVAEAEGNKMTIIAYELGGRFGGEALAFFNEIARDSTTTSAAANAFKNYWLRRIATVAQRALGRLIRARLPSSSLSLPRGLRAQSDPLAHVVHAPNPATINARARGPALL